MSLTALMLDNAEADVASLASVVNGAATDPDVVTRLGLAVKPLAKVIAEIEAAGTTAGGYEPAVAYAAGINILRTSQTVEYLGETYAPLSTAIPFVTGAGFDPTKWKLIIAKQLVTRAQMKAATAADGDVLLLVDGFKTGTFKFTTANVKVYCDADPLEGVFIKPTGGDGTAGAWVRLFEQRLDVRWFGAVLNNVTDDHAAVQAAVALSYALRRAPAIGGVEYGNGGGPAVVIPGFGYMGAGTLVLNHNFRLFGFMWGGPAGIVSGLRWADGVTGIENPGRAQIDGIAIIGGFAGAEGEHHGIHATSPFPYRNLSFGDWSGDAMNLDDGGGLNVNGVVGENVWVYNCRDAYNNLGGGDNNAGVHKNWNVSACRRWGIDELTFLGVGHHGHEIDSCGITSYNDGVSIGCSVTSYSGNRYFAIAGQEVWCSTHAPSGTTTDNTGWAYMGTGGAIPSLGIIAWFNGILVRAGGSYYCPGANGGSTFAACYSEGGQGFAQVSSPAVVMSPNMAVWFHRSMAAQFLARNGQMYSPGGFISQGYLGTDEIVNAQLGEVDGNNKTAWAITATVSLPLTLRCVVDSGDVGYTYGGGGLYTAFTGPNTARAFGRTAPVPYVSWYLNGVALGSAGVTRIITMDAAAPVAGNHQVGEIVLNYNPSGSGAGSNLGWRCSAAGTPGTWEQIGGVAAHIANLSAAPTQADFNNLLAALQAAGLMA